MIAMKGRGTPMDDSIDALLAEVAAGRLPPERAAERLRSIGYTSVGDYACLDVSRAARKGVPEVVFAEGKTDDQLVAIVARFLDHSPWCCAAVSRRRRRRPWPPVCAVWSSTMRAAAWSSCAGRARRCRRSAALSAYWPPVRAMWPWPARRRRSVRRWACGWSAPTMSAWPAFIVLQPLWRRCARPGLPP